MALQYVGGASATSAGATTYSIDLTSLTGGIASSPSAGDIVIVGCGSPDDTDINPGVSTSGYTEVADLYVNHRGTNLDTNFSINYKIMSSTPDTSVGILASSSSIFGEGAVAHVWRGVDQTTPLDATTTTATGTGSNNPDSPSITTVTNNAVVLSIAAYGSGSSRVLSSQPTGYSNTVYDTIDPSRAIGVMVASKLVATAGAEDPSAWSMTTTGTASSWAAGTIALRPSTNVNYTLTVGTGTFTLTGFATTLTSQRKMLVETGVFTLTGFNVALIYGMKLLVETGVFVVTGIDVGLSLGRKMLVETANFVLTGFATQFRVAHRIAVETASFVLTMINARLKSSAWSNPSKSSSTWTNNSKSETTWSNNSKSSTTWTNLSK